MTGNRGRRRNLAPIQNPDDRTVGDAVDTLLLELANCPSRDGHLRSRVSETLRRAYTNLLNTWPTEH